MKIYVSVGNNGADIAAFKGILASITLFLPKDCSDYGSFCLDNDEHKVYPPSLEEEGHAIDNGWFLQAFDDADRIVKMYNNELLTRFNSGKPRWSMMDHEAMLPMIDVLEFGAAKYAEDNWRKPVENPMEVWESLNRHVLEIKSGMKEWGDIYDKDSNLNHIGHAMCNLMFLSYHLIQKGEQKRKRPE